MEYPQIPHDGIESGLALFTLVEPHRGHEVAYNRWYERDHFYAGCLIGPMWFAGKRWVATKPLKDLRYPTETPFLPDVSQGSYLATYWVLKGHEAEGQGWGSTQVKWLLENERMFPERDHVHTLMYVNRWSASRDDDGVPEALALDHPWGGLVAVMVDHTDASDKRDLGNWLRDEFLPGYMAGTPWALTSALTPIPLPEGTHVEGPVSRDVERRTLLMGFVDTDPRECWDVFAGLGDAVAAGGKGVVSYAAPFIPTIVGTDTYTDELW